MEAKTEKKGNIIDAFFAVCQKPENTQPGRVAQLLKNLGSLIKIFFARHSLQNLFHILVMIMKFFMKTDFNIFSHLCLPVWSKV